MSQVTEVEILPGLHFIEFVKYRQNCKFLNTPAGGKNVISYLVQTQKPVLCVRI